METAGSVWLVRNPASGSNDEGRLEELDGALKRAGLAVAKTILFPSEPLPTADKLDAAGIATLVVFAGDGTVNAAVTGLYGWGGRILVLPGGTMNLLSIILHGERDAPAILARLDDARVRRIPVIRTASGDALAGLIVGPGTAWNHVREAMRAGDVLRFISETASAIEESTAGSMVICEPAKGCRSEGYSAIMLTPDDKGIIAEGYYAASFADYAQQGLALLRRNFRQGPHDKLGTFEALTCRGLDGEATDLLIDGEPAEGGHDIAFELAHAEVDLITTGG
ncbi:diacylglycerol kinase family protein [Novosphingobium sp. ZN18A2]|uniref:diacylglycerol/lipid kinase family protein n=1 Tax=Novosphingobium sp. ZN18A2 TaxID=3079861 RepID=UPI0030D0BCFC